MEKNIYKIEIKGYSNEYVQGRISGMTAALCDEQLEFTYLCDISRLPWQKYRIKACLITVRATAEECRKVKDTINKFYPNLCTFYKKEG